MFGAKTKNKTQNNPFISPNPVEAITDMSKSVVQTTADATGVVINDMWDQLLGGGTYSEKAPKQESGELKEGQELDLASLRAQKRAEKKNFADIDPGIDYKREILHKEKKVASENAQIIQVQIEQILVELKKLIAQSSELEIQYRTIAVETVPVNAGEYHVTFFEWVLSVITAARMKVEDSANWLSLFTSKKHKRQYWSMFKKHGTTFGLSNERVVATQTG